MHGEKYIIIVNPISGTVSKETIVGKVTDIIKSEGGVPSVRFTEHSGHATKLAQEAIDAGCNNIIVIGGDGTINEVATALVKTTATLGIIPCGSGNGLARHLRIPLNVEKATRMILKGCTQAIDYCTVNGKMFFCTFGLGFDASVASDFARQSNRGLATYIKSALRVYKNYKPDNYVIKYGEEILNEQFYIVSTCNASQYGNNAKIASKAVIDDGLLDVVLVRPGNHLSRAGMTVKMFTGRIKSGKNIIYLQVPKVSFSNTSNKVFPVHLDGEPFEMSGEIVVECHKRQLNVFVPES